MQDTTTCLIEKNPLIRQALKGLLRASSYDPDIVMSEISEIAEWPHSNIEMLIICLYQFTNDMTAEVKMIRDRFPGIHIVILSDELHQQSMVGAFSSGIDGYLLKTISLESLIASLNLVMTGEKVFPSAMATLLLNNDMLRNYNIQKAYDSSLNFSEEAQKIIRCLVEGCSNKVIARRLNISEESVKVKLKTILRKLELSNRTQVAVWALKNGGHGSMWDITMSSDYIPYQHSLFEACSEF